MPGAAFLALVIAVHDGDSIRVQHPIAGLQSIRVAEIDAPELRQHWGRVAGRSLRRLCLGKMAWVQPHNADRYGRTVAAVRCGKTDAGHHQVERGMAWVFLRYAPPSSALYAVQMRAQQHRRGLWVQHDATPPWDWRADARPEKY